MFSCCDAPADKLSQEETHEVTAEARGVDPTSEKAEAGSAQDIGAAPVLDVTKLHTALADSDTGRARWSVTLNKREGAAFGLALFIPTDNSHVAVKHLNAVG